MAASEKFGYIREKLEQDAVEQPETAAPARRRVPRRRQREKGSSEQRGARADPAYTQVNGNIPKELHASLFYYLKRDGLTLSGLLEDLLTAWVEKQGGVLGK